MEKLHSQMLQHMINRSLETEVDTHLGHARNHRGADNTRNGKARKHVQSAVGGLGIEPPRECHGRIESQRVKRRQVRLAGMEGRSLTLCAKDMTTRGIESALVDMYGVTIAHSLNAQVFGTVIDEARARKNRPLKRSTRLSGWAAS